MLMLNLSNMEAIPK